MKYCNDCFAKTEDSTLRCEACNSKDLRFFETTGPGKASATDAPSKIKLDPIYLIDSTKGEAAEDSPRVLHFEPTEKDRRALAKMRKRSQRSNSRGSRFFRAIRRAILSVTTFSLVIALVSSNLWIGAVLVPGQKVDSDRVTFENVISQLRAGIEPEPQRFYAKVESEVGGGFEFLNSGVNGQSPMWDPCRPIYWVVNRANEPEGARAELKAAFSQVSKLTGLKFEYAGETEEKFVIERPSENSTYLEFNSPWNPVLVQYLPDRQWNKASQEIFGESGEDIAGFAGPDSEWARGLVERLVYVSGRVVLSTSSIETMFEYGRPDFVRALMLHELGHLVGLDHVENERELMDADNYAVTQFGPGDRRGLSALGSATCLKDALYPKNF